MSEQIPDTCTFDDRTWVIEFWSGSSDCVPTNEQLEIETISPHTANWAGRIDHFLVAGDQLYLFKVEVTLADPLKSSVPTDARREVLLRYEPIEIIDKEGTRNEIRECREEFFIFDDLRIPFTGILHLRSPYHDGWNLPASAYPGDEQATRVCRLEFVVGKLVNAEQPEREDQQRPSPRAEAGDGAETPQRRDAALTSGSLNEGSIVKALAEDVAKRLTRKVMATLQRSLATLSGDHSGLRSTWEEICVQVQYEESVFWDVYHETVETLVAGLIEELPKHEKEALWLQTDEGFDWECEDPDDRESHPVFITDIMHYLVNQHVYAEAGRWSNARIRAYIERASMTD